MQIAGKDCTNCSTRLLIETEGLGCHSCEKAYCSKCLEGSEDCPECGENMLHQKERHDQEKAEGHRMAESQNLSKGGIYPWAIGIVALFNLFNATGHAAKGRQIDASLSAGMLILMIVLLIDYFRRGVPIWVSTKRRPRR